MQLVNPNPKGRKCLKSLIDQQHISKHIIDRQCYRLGVARPFLMLKALFLTLP
jgi:hypothetical protein